MDLSTTYLGLELRTPLVASASPLSDSLDGLKRMEDAGASAAVLSSLFEEQLRRDRDELLTRLTEHTHSFSEAQTFFPAVTDFHWGPEAYLEHIRKAKKAVRMPIVASLNGTSLGGWTAYAREIEKAGADALELNIYFIPTDPSTPGEEIERTHVDILKAVKAATTLPVAVKIAPFFSSLANMAKRLDDAGADGLVLFNRFYQPDFDLDRLELRPNLLLSTPQALRLPLHWTAVLHGKVKADLAATSGVHAAGDVLKLLMAGASVTMMASALFKFGIDHIRAVETELVRWMEEREYESVAQMRGSMSQMRCADPGAFERQQYIKTLTTYKPH
ncbi:MAG: dihydroorotate dehydrogenase-like protein [Elusimicrobia bacterium]|nr:dihydroorotate dehydrogenase-like protein [Elusimicrobiota bacterium]